MALYKFQIFSADEFVNHIMRTTFKRIIKAIQNHHTWKPSYTHFNKPGASHMIVLENMRNAHIHDRGWSDIGQNITIFPDGKVAVCRPIDVTPAGIFGANTGGICIEALGNFDTGGDVLTAEQEKAIIYANAVLCIKFGLRPNPSSVVYHHWYDTKGKRFSDQQINSGFVLKNSLQKTCPGTNFFGGNTIDAAIANFYPKINEAISIVTSQPATPPATAIRKVVNVDVLNVRSGRGTSYPALRKLSKGALVDVYAQDKEWSRVSVSNEEWVFSKYLS